MTLKMRVKKVLYGTTLFGSGTTPANRPHVVCGNDRAVLTTAHLATQIPDLKIAALATTAGNHPATASSTGAFIAALHCRNCP
jgi:hypothetical protein